MIGLIFTIIFWTVYLGGYIYMAPILAMQEARNRGRLHVHTDDAVLGATRAVMWPLFGITTYTQRVGDKKLGQLPEVQYERMLATQSRVDALDASINPQLQSKEHD